MNSSKYALVMALMLHLFVGSLVFFYFLPSYFYRPITVNKARVNAYLIDAAVVSQKMRTASKAVPIKTMVAASTPHLPLSSANPTKLPSDTKSVAAALSTQPLATQASTSDKAKPITTMELSELLRLVANSIQAHLDYPPLSETHVEQGQAVLQFLLTPTGQLQNIKLIQSSGVTRLDAAAIAAIRASSPINIPSDIKVEETLTLQVPVDFSIDTGSV